jgi:hypothetical protein
MARLLRHNGLPSDVFPLNGRYFEFDELYALLDCSEVLRITLPGSLVLVFDAVPGISGELHHANILATEILRMYSPNTLLSGGWVRGDAMVLTRDEAAAPR